MAESTLLDRIDADLKEAMRRRDEATKLALRSVKTAITQEQKAGSASRTLTEAEIVRVITKAAKQRRDAIAEYEKAGRTDLVQREQAELTVLEQYLPRSLTEDEVEEMLRAIIAETGAQSLRDMGKVMPVAMQRLAGRADGRVVNQIVRRLLQ